MIFDYDHPETWPADVVSFLDDHRAVLDDWLGAQCFASPYRYDEIIRELYAVLRNHEILAWHSTRLTEREITRIVAEGMELPTVETLMRRIDAAEAQGAFPQAIAQQFKGRHQADSPTRQGRIWFLFTRPHHDDGIQDFLRFWGGEALYAAIDRDPELGPVLRSVGAPAIVEAAIPMSFFEDSLGFESHIAGHYCAWRAGRDHDAVPHDRVLAPIPAHLIRRIVTFHDAEFAELTGCGTYFDPLAYDAPD